MLNRSGKSRLHINSIEEISLDRDEELAELFREMREATGMSAAETAQKLNTGSEIIEALEAGAITRLPAWPETQRIITDYAGLLGLDCDPMLRRIMLHMPTDHPRRPKTEQLATPSVTNLQSNVEAAINRVPDYHEPRESTSVPLQQDSGATGQGEASRSSIPAGIRPQTGQAIPIGQGVQRRVMPTSPTPAATTAPAPKEKAGAPQAPQAAAGKAKAGGDFAPGYGEFRAYPPEPTTLAKKQPAPMVETKRKSGLFVTLMQLLLLLVILASGYAMWLALNDPPAFEQLKTTLGDYWGLAVERVSVFVENLSK